MLSLTAQRSGWCKSVSGSEAVKKLVVILLLDDADARRSSALFTCAARDRRRQVTNGVTATDV